MGPDDSKHGQAPVLELHGLELLINVGALEALSPAGRISEVAGFLALVAEHPQLNEASHEEDDAKADRTREGGGGLEATGQIVELVDLLADDALEPEEVLRNEAHDREHRDTAVLHLRGAVLVELGRVPTR